jgi:integrase
LPARRKYAVPRGLKPVRRKLATGEVRVYWYHRDTGERLRFDPATAEGFLEVAALDARSQAIEAVSEVPKGSLAALWLGYTASPEWRGLKPRTRSDYQAVREWLGDSAQKATVKLVTPAQILSLRDKAAAVKGRRFGNYVLAVVRLVLEWGRLRGWRNDNPAMGLKSIRKPKGQANVNRAWRAEEVEAFVRGCPPQILAPFALGLFAGMRQGDALSVTWAAYNGVNLTWCASKNDELCVAPVTGVFKAILDGALEAQHRAAIPALQIAVNAFGQTWTESGFRASFFKRVRRLTAEKTLQPGCTFHGLRHTIGAFARDGAESEFRIAAAIGDKTTAMAAIYGRDANRLEAQSAVLGDVQRRFAAIEWKVRPGAKA